MSLNTERAEVDGVMGRLLDNLSLTISSQVGDKAGAMLRQKIGDLRVNYAFYLADGIFSDKLLEFLTLTRQNNAKLASIATVRDRLFLEEPVGGVSIGIVQVAVVFCLSAESRMITDIEFVSRDDVDAMIKTMKIAFDKGRDLAADAIDSFSYQTLTFLAGALISHLSSTARPLPRMVAFKMAIPMPALALSNLIYYTAERYQEVIDENHVVNPAFCPRQIRGLSA